MDLRMSDGFKIKFEGLSRNRGVVWVYWDDIKTHILIKDLDEESQTKVNQLLEEERIKSNAI